MDNPSSSTNGITGADETGLSPEPIAPPSSFRLVSQFFFFPLIIVIAGVSIFVIFGLIGSDTKTAKDYILELRMSNGRFQGNRRWQAACELSTILAKNKDPRLAHDLAPELIRIFSTVPQDDPKVRRYLALALGRLGDPQAIPVLVQAIRDEDAETRVYSIYALGELRAKEAVPDMISLYKTDDVGLRKMIVYVLGVLGDLRAVPTLRTALSDRQEDVQWNAATALARLKDPYGVPTLQHMLDRVYLNTIKDMRDDQKEDVMISAIQALTLLKDRTAESQLRAISGHDPSLKVRNAAYEALRSLTS
ncbi:MAG: HEAT repeat domain-containing protein [Acidobacteria bacterium]|nr:HEAT repeat domain-containing protein [Acidobacteriota bacterium]MBI3656951.1 HEAT repeat domain-containing protein [Acidobacteriota bacterium]